MLISAVDLGHTEKHNLKQLLATELGEKGSEKEKGFVFEYLVGGEGGRRDRWITLARALS